MAVLSGKGGVGKSMIAASLIELLGWNGVGADVDNPNLQIWLNIKSWNSETPVYLSTRAKVKGSVRWEDKYAFCPFGAIRAKEGLVWVAEYLCEGCGLCAEQFPDVFELRSVQTGWIKKAIFENSEIVVGELLPGRTGSGRLVDLIFEQVKEPLIADGPPGTGCPAKATIRNADFVLVVVEPTRNSLFYATRLIDLLEFMGKEYALVLNKAGLNAEIEKQTSRLGEVIVKIPFEPKVFWALTQRKTPIRAKIERVKEALEKLADFIKEI